MATAFAPEGFGKRLDFSGTRKHLEKSRHLPGEFYYSPDIFCLEIEKIFMKDWLGVRTRRQAARRAAQQDGRQGQLRVRELPSAHREGRHVGRVDLRELRS